MLQIPKKVGCVSLPYQDPLREVLPNGISFRPQKSILCLLIKINYVCLQFEIGCELTIENYIYKKIGEKAWTMPLGKNKTQLRFIKHHYIFEITTYIRFRC